MGMYYIKPTISTTHNYCWLQLGYLENTSMATTAGITDRHYCRSFPRSTLLVLVMISLWSGALWFVYWSIEAGTYKTILDCTHYVLWVLLPVTGWVAESWLGRYRAIVIGLIMSTLTASSCFYGIAAVSNSCYDANYCCTYNWHHWC